MVIAAARFAVMELFYIVAMRYFGILLAEKFAVTVKVFFVTEVYFELVLVFAVSQIIDVILALSAVGKILLVCFCCSSFSNSIIFLSL